MSIYLVGARWSKKREPWLARFGYTEEQIARRRCSICNCKLVIHRNSLEEWSGIDFVLICSDCEVRVNTNEHLPRVMTTTAYDLLQQALNNLRRN